MSDRCGATTMPGFPVPACELPPGHDGDHRCESIVWTNHEKQRCRHMRQIHKGKQLPCAHPGCPEGIKSPMLYTVEMPKLSFSMASEPLPPSGPIFKETEWTRKWTEDRSVYKWFPKPEAP